VRGAFQRISLCVYGHPADPAGVALWGKDAVVAEAGMTMEM